MFRGPPPEEDPMPLLSLRYDLRCAPFDATTPADLMATALDQCAWADQLGFAAVTLSEHHGSPDGYLPSPLVFAAAVAARTQRVRIILGALITPLHDPVRIAEDMAVLDVISNGRLVPILGAGYVASEFATFGKRLEDRARSMDAIVPFLERAWTGEPFEHEGRSVRVTPRPVQRPRPPILMGCATKVAARRAARFADGLLPTLPELYEEFRAERARLGKPDPGPLAPTTGSFMHVALDPDAAWARIAPHAMHEMNAYGAWAAESGAATGYRPIADPAQLRATGLYPVLTPDELIARARALGPGAGVTLHPLMGGMDPELSWESLRLIESKVIPALRS
jgi:alkanesulfonate monooxygenase SsuD/methylene tetrahydromethanopterin reductase-like flavin-dependent oxidoreductase (luciferase family)